jgi:hypothetical protein
LGGFVILAAVLNRYYNFSIPYSPIFLNWYVGELSTAVFVANIPLCWPLLRRIFRVGTFADKNSGNSPSGYPSQRHTGNAYGNGSKNTLRSALGQRLPSTDEAMVGFSESEERINRSQNWPIAKDHIALSPMGNKVGHQTVVQVGKDGEGSDQEYEANTHDIGITKTVQVTQYTL